MVLGENSEYYRRRSCWKIIEHPKRYGPEYKGKKGRNDRGDARRGKNERLSIVSNAHHKPILTESMGDSQRISEIPTCAQPASCCTASWRRTEPLTSLCNIAGKAGLAMVGDSVVCEDQPRCRSSASHRTSWQLLRSPPSREQVRVLPGHW